MDPRVERLCIRNFPDSFDESDIKEFLSRFGIDSVELLKRRSKFKAVVHISDSALARVILSRLHQLKVLDKRLIVEYHQDDAPGVEIVDAAQAGTGSKVGQTGASQELSKFVKALHAVHPVDFDQPPPPYLRYRYPRPTREIIDSICVALESVPKFYTQVLHLMNRMNLPPPFTARDVLRNGSRVEKKDVSQQTDPVRIKETLLDEGESELESDEDDHKIKGPIKRTSTLEKNRFKPYVLPQIVNAPANDSHPPKPPQYPKPIKPAQGIVLRLPDELKTSTKIPTPPLKATTPPPPATPPPSASEIDPLANRIPTDQLSELPVFKNYTPGEPSNKLYLKNLAKTVTEDDLKRIFHRFAITTDPDREITIKLMQAGRMKGQAFVTFSYMYEEDLDRLQEKPIARALRLTNGLILRDKPMVVVYGKQSAFKTDDGEAK